MVAQYICDFKLIFPFCRGYQRSMVKSMSLAAKVPHFHYLEEINCDSLVQLKTTFQNENKDHTIKHTFLPFLIKSLSMALSKYPMLNSSFIEETNEVVFKGMQSLNFSFRSCFLSSQKRIQKTVELMTQIQNFRNLPSENCYLHFPIYPFNCYFTL